MGESSIEWTDYTFNPWWGCVRVSPGCENCYAETWDGRFGGDHWGVNAPRRFFSKNHWQQPINWNRKAEQSGIRRRVFCASMADVFEERDDLDEQRERLWRTVNATPWLDWLLLTKRPHAIERYLPDSLIGADSVWLGCTTENEEWLRRRWQHLSKFHDNTLFLSYEPALGPLGLGGVLTDPEDNGINPDWVIAGAESGTSARAMDESWVREVRDDCMHHGIRFFYKQRLAGGRKVSLPLLDGKQWAEFPNARI